MARSTCASWVLVPKKLRRCGGGFSHLRKIGIAPIWMFTMICKRGDVVLVVFPDSNLLTAKARPALVVQADLLNTSVNQVIVAMIPPILPRPNHPIRVLIS